MTTSVDLEEYVPTHPNRKRVYERMHSLLLENATEDNLNPEAIQKMALNLERGIFNWALDNRSATTLDRSTTWNEVFKSLYVNRAISILTNLNPKSQVKNPHLIKRLLNREINEFQLCYFDSKQMYPEHWKRIMENHVEDMSQVLVQDTNVSEGLFKCGKCKSRKTTYMLKQIRSGDEGSTTFVTCVNCGNRWKFN